MYRVLRASILYYNSNMKEVKGRYNLVKPFLLLTNTQLFNKAKKNGNDEYVELLTIVERMKELFNTGKDEYHHFDMLLRELDVLGFKVDTYNKVIIKTDEEKLEQQISLLLQFLAFRYPFDEYDNKTGVHDISKNEYIFIQP